MNERLEEMLSMSRTGKTAAYIHVPFCETHCLYCGFYTKAYGPEESARYTDALLRELALNQTAHQGAPERVVTDGRAAHAGQRRQAGTQSKQRGLQIVNLHKP